MECMIIITGNCSDVIYHRLVDCNKINKARPLRKSDQALWGVWRNTLGLDRNHKARPCAPDLLSSAWWRQAHAPDLADQTGQLSPLTARGLALLDLSRHLWTSSEMKIMSLYKNVNGHSRPVIRQITPVYLLRKSPVSHIRRGREPCRSLAH